ncbi:MAG: MFS transporter [Bacteroidetes bacterium HGW-Bacteroidetes-11]|jgi:MFS family permease|nr:MAG: MFS transporter [Bacteroidetes bacterium HGW-Bacteroidetes-11]
MTISYQKDRQYYKFCAYGFFKNLKFFEPFLVLFLLSKGLSFLQIGTLYAIREITINIFEIPTGVLADSLGRRRSMMSAFLFYIVSFVVFYFSSSYWWFVAAMLFYAYGDAFRTGTHKAMIFEYLKINGWQDQKVHYYGHTRSWSQKGSAVSAVLAAAIVFISSDYRYVFLFSLIPYLIDLWLLSTYPKVLDGRRVGFNKGKIIESFRSTIRDFISSFRNAGMLRVVMSQAVYSGYYKAVKDYLQPVVKTFALSLPFFMYLETGQRSALMIGLIYSIIYFSTSYTARNAGRYASRFKNLSQPMNITMIAGLLVGAISGLLFYQSFYLAAIVFYAVIFLIENLRKPIGISLVADRLEKDVLATALSAESQAETLVAAMIAPLLGFAADKWGVGAALMMVSLLLIVLMPLYRAGKPMTKNKLHS